MKIFLKIIAAVVILLIVAIITIPIIFKDDLVQIAKKETNKALNAEVEFGDFSISLISSFPNLELNMKDLTISGVNEFEGVDLAKIKDLSLVVDLMSVINGESIELKSIILDEPAVYAQVLSNGKANWDIAKSTDSTAVEAPVDTASSGFSMNLENIEIIDGIVVYDDASMPMFMLLEGLNLQIKGNMSGDVTSLLADGKIDKVDFEFDGVEYINEAVVALDADLKMNMEQMKFTFEENELSINQLPLALDGWLAMPEDAIDMDLTLASKDTDFKTILSLVPAAFAKDLDGVETQGEVAFSGYAKGTYLDSIFPAFGFDLKIANAMFKYPDLPSAVEDVQLLASINSPGENMDEMSVEVPKFHMNMAGNPLDISLLMKNVMSNPHIKASANGKLILGNIKQVVPLEEGTNLEGTFIADLNVDGYLSSLENEQYQDFKASGGLQVSDFLYESDSLDYPIGVSAAKLTFNNLYAELSNLNMAIGRSDIQASGRLEGFIPYAMTDNGVLKGNVNINSNLIDANEMMGISPTEEVEAEEEAQTEDKPMEVVTVPENVDIILKAKVNQLLYDNLDIKNINATLKVKEEKVSIDNSSLDMLGGSMTVGGFYETSDSLQPTFDFGMDISNFDLQQTVDKFVSIEKIAPIIKKTLGKYSTDFNLSGAFNSTMDPVYESLFGGGSVHTDNIEIKDFKPLEKIGQTLNSSTLQNPVLKDMDIQMSIADGKLFVEPFTNKIGDIKMTVAGSNSFDQTINYVLSFEIPREELGSSANNAANQIFSQASAKGFDLELAEYIYVDAIVSGKFSDPTVKIDLKETVSNITEDIKEQAKEALQEKKEELEQKAKEELEQKKKEAEEKLKEEIERQKKEAEEKAKKELEDAAKDKLKDLFGR